MASDALMSSLQLRPHESAGPVVNLEIRHRLGTLQIDAKFQVTAPWTVLFGPSGSGKSTLLRSIAGLVRPDAGHVDVLGRQVLDRAAGVWVRADRRPVRWAGQQAALFPNRTVLENVRMGLGEGFAGRSGGDALQEVLSGFGLAGMADRRVDALSGGQRQLVSVVRAAVGARGKVLLLDEPFSGLDAGVRERLLAGLRWWLRGAPVISVTHDVAEALLLDAEVIRLAEGKVVAQGAAAEVLGDERDRLRGLLG